MRLYLYLKNELNLTKSEVKNYFLTHDVYVGDVKASLLTKIDSTSKIYSVAKDDICDNDDNTLDNLRIDKITYFSGPSDEDFIYLAYNKPRGVECTNDKNNPNSILNYINIDKRIYTVGRLDKDSHGLIILTNDNSFPNLVLNKENHVAKKYICVTKEEIDLPFVTKLSEPTLINGKYTKKCITELIDNHTFLIILEEGMNRQIRRMALNLGKRVIDLKRISFGKCQLDLEENEYKFIKKEDII